MPHAHLRTIALVGTVMIAGAAGCLEGEPAPEDDEAVAQSQQAVNNNTGKKLFERETFGGNGRTCQTCHTKKTGELSPAQVRELAETDPDNELFRSIDSDDGVGSSYERLKANATIRIHMPLPPNVRLKNDPDATEFVVNRAVPTTDNVALFSTLMWDTRHTDLAALSLGAVHDHTENTIEPTQDQLEKMADFQRTLFSSPRLKKYAAGGPAPELPPGKTASEKRGRTFFEADGRCGMCHGGPMLNRTTEFENIFGIGPDSDHSGAFAGFPALLGEPQPEDAANEIVEWEMDCVYDLNGDGEISDIENGDFACGIIPFLGGTVENGVATFAMPDPGVTLFNGDLDAFLFFKIPTLWGAADSAPYFHDNSAENLDELFDTYDLLFTRFAGQPPLSAQDRIDIGAYFQLLK
jgi:hypothetical protein